MVRATEPKKDKNHKATTENAACEDHDKKTKYVGIPDDKFEELLKEGLEKYDHIIYGGAWPTSKHSVVPTSVENP